MEEPRLKTPYEAAGIQCESGWASLYEPLMERCKAEGVEIHQIKEKFGGLRFYIGSGASKELRAAIEDAERRSFQTCETCGSPGTLQEGSYLRTRCEACSRAEAAGKKA